MKNLINYINESLLDDEDDLIQSTIDISSEIKKWIKENTIMKKGVKISKRKGKYYVSAIQIDLTSNIDHLTNGLFEWDRVNTFSCVGCLNLKSLEGGPKHSYEFNCSGCKMLTSLEGAPEKCEKFYCDNCDSLKSLKGCPKICTDFNCSYCTQLTTLEYAPQFDTSGTQYLLHFDELFDCTGCKNLKTLKGMTEKWPEFKCKYCKKLTSLEGGPKECRNFNCIGCDNLVSLKGSPQKCDKFNCSHCKKLASLKEGPKICYVFNCSYCVSLTSLEGIPEQTWAPEVKNCGRKWTEEDAEKYHIWLN